MAKYIDIAGNNIPIRSSNPSNPILGEIWYNTTDNVLRAQGFDAVGAWSSGNNINTARQQAAEQATVTRFKKGKEICSR